jgi:hypothetical protein
MEALPMSKPLALTDTQMNTVISLAEPLEPADRDTYLRQVAERLNGHELGDGYVTRVCREVQSGLFRPPDFSRASGSSKYR